MFSSRAVRISCDFRCRIPEVILQVFRGELSGTCRRTPLAVLTCAERGEISIEEGCNPPALAVFPVQVITRMTRLDLVLNRFSSRYLGRHGGLSTPLGI